MITLEELQYAVKATLRDRRGMERASARRRSLRPGTSRARATTANARASTAAQGYDRSREYLVALCHRAIEEGIEYHGREPGRKE